MCAAREQLLADVVFMFQPGEETAGGAKEMVDEGVLTAAGPLVDAAYSLHVFSAGAPRGLCVGRPGLIMAAADLLNVTVHGRGGHGSAPQAALDPVPALCEMVLGTQVLLGRHFDIFDPAVITVGKIQAGTAANVIPDSGSFEATLRSFSPPARQKLADLLPPMLKGIADAHLVSVDVDVQQKFPPTSNDPAQTQFAARIAQQLFGETRYQTLPTPLPGSEDFSYVLNEVPGAYLGLSAVPEGVDPMTAPYNHSPLAVYDDGILADQTALLASLALQNPAVVIP